MTVLSRWMELWEVRPLHLYTPATCSHHRGRCDHYSLLGTYPSLESWNDLDVTASLLSRVFLGLTHWRAITLTSEEIQQQKGQRRIRR
jgi:hypothetical protein